MYSSRILIMTQLLKISKFKVRPSFLQENQNAVKSAPYRIEGKTLSAKIHNLSTQRKYWQNKLQKLHHIGANEWRRRPLECYPPTRVCLKTKDS